MKRRFFKVGATFGHCGQGNGVAVYIPVIACNPVTAIKHAGKIGGLKKQAKHFWFAQEIDGLEYLILQLKWHQFKNKVYNKSKNRNRVV